MLVSILSYYCIEMVPPSVNKILVHIFTVHQTYSTRFAQLLFFSTFQVHTYIQTFTSL